MDVRLELIRLSEANKHLKQSLDLLDYNSCLIVTEIIKTNNDKIDYYNKQNLSVLNKTNKENGLISSSLKKVVLGYYSEYLNKIKNRKKYDELKSEIKNKCSNTCLPDNLISSKILIHRRYPNCYAMDNLGIELNEYIKNEMIKCFNEQNKDFIKTRILSHTGA